VTTPSFSLLLGIIQEVNFFFPSPPFVEGNATNVFFSFLFLPPPRKQRNDVIEPMMTQSFFSSTCLPAVGENRDDTPPSLLRRMTVDRQLPGLLPLLAALRPGTMSSRLRFSSFLSPLPATCGKRYSASYRPPCPASPSSPPPFPSLPASSEGVRVMSFLPDFPLPFLPSLPGPDVNTRPTELMLFLRLLSFAAPEPHPHERVIRFSALLFFSFPPANC